MHQTNAGQVPAFRFCRLDKSAQVRYPQDMSVRPPKDVTGQPSAFDVVPLIITSLLFGIGIGLTLVMWLL